MASGLEGSAASLSFDYLSLHLRGKEPKEKALANERCDLRARLGLTEFGRAV